MKTKTPKGNDRRVWEVWHNAAVVKQVHDYWLGSPDELRHRRIVARLVKDLLPLPTASILEVGCGTGLVYEALREAVGPELRYTGVDNSKPMLALAEKRYPAAYFEEGDAFKLGYPAGAFDVACAFEVFGHMPDCSGPISELVRVARHAAIFTLWIGGKAITFGNDHYEYPPDFVHEALARATEKHGEAWTFVDLNPIRAYVVRKS